MPTVVDRVRDTTSTTGTGSITLSDVPPTGFQSFNSGVGVGNPFFYAIVGGTEWEVGRGVLSASTTLVRDQILGSSNGGSVVNFSAGVKEVFLTAAAHQIDVFVDCGRFYAGIRGNQLP